MSKLINALKIQFNPSARMSRDVSRMMRAKARGGVYRMKYLCEKIYRRYSCCVSPFANIEPDVVFPHPVGIVIGEGVVVESGCTIYQNVTLGRSDKDLAAYPRIGQGSVIYAGATVIGGIDIKPGTTIGAHAVVTKSNNREGDVLIGAPAHSKYQN